MNVGTIITPNSKGQVVIPWRIRKQLGIEPQTPLRISVSGEGIYIHPISQVLLKGDSADEIFAEILKRTAGSWGKATKEDKRREARRKKIELAASKRRRKVW